MEPQREAEDENAPEPKPPDHPGPVRLRQSLIWHF